MVCGFQMAMGGRHFSSLASAYNWIDHQGRNFTHFAWVRDQKGVLHPQLWTEDLIFTKLHTPVRKDLMRHIASSVVKVVKLKDDEAQISLDEAMKRYSYGS